MSESVDKETRVESNERVEDAAKAHDMAGASTGQRSMAALLRQLGSVSEDHATGELSKEAAESKLEQLSDTYPESKRLDINMDSPKGLRRVAERKDRLAEQIEYWADILHDNPREGLSPEGMVGEVESLQELEGRINSYKAFADGLDKLVGQRGLSLLEGESGLEEFRIGPETRELIRQYDLKVRELLGNPSTTVGQLVALKKELINNCVSNEQFGLPGILAEKQEFIESVKNGKTPVSPVSQV